MQPGTAHNQSPLARLTVQSHSFARGEALSSVCCQSQPECGSTASDTASPERDLAARLNLDTNTNCHGVTHNPNRCTAQTKVATPSPPPPHTHNLGGGTGGITQSLCHACGKKKGPKKGTQLNNSVIYHKDAMHSLLARVAATHSFRVQGTVSYVP